MKPTPILAVVILRANDGEIFSEMRPPTADPKAIKVPSTVQSQPIIAVGEPLGRMASMTSQ
jgi:hypothetical protein